MEFTEFKQITGVQNPPKICLFEGEEVYLAEDGLKHLLEIFVDFPEMDYARLDGEDFSPADLVTQALSFPFMSKKRLVAVTEFYPTASMINGVLKDMFTGLPDSTIVAILNRKSCDALKKQKTVTTVSCIKQQPAFLSKWIVKEFSRFDKTITASLANKIAEYSLMDMTKIFNEVQKLSSYVGDRTDILEKDIDAVVIKDAEYKIYEMTDYVGKRDFDKALTIVTDMINNGEAPQRLLVSLYYYYRKLFHVAISTQSDVELATALSMKEYAVKKLRQQAKSFKVKSLKTAIDTLADADYAFKSGARDVDNAFMLSVFNLMIK